VKPVRLLIALVILAGLGGAVWYSEKHPASPETKTDEKTVKILTIPADQIKRLQFSRAAGVGDEFTLERGDDGKWKITAPKPYKADETPVGTMVSNLSSLSTTQVLSENNTDWATYGLDKPKLIVTVTQKDGKQNKVSFGFDAPASSVVYARLDDQPRLFTVPSFIKASLDNRLTDVRDRHLVPFDDTKVARMELTAKGQQPIEFSKAGQNWQIIKPRPMRADSNAVDEIMRAAHNAIFDSVLDESANPPAKYSFSSPVATLRVTDAAGAYTLTIAKEPEKASDKDKSSSTTQNYYAKSSALPGVFRISSTLPDALNKSLDTLRNKKLFDFGFSDPQKLEMRDGDTSMVIEKKGDKWVRSDAGSKELPSDKVQALVDDLRNLTAKEFTSDDAAAQSKYGLDKPKVEARVTSGDGKTTERVVMSSANSKAGRNVVRQLEVLRSPGK
jgi:hypothetical protein